MFQYEALVLPLSLPLEKTKSIMNKLLLLFFTSFFLNGIAQWQQMPSGTSGDLDGIHFFDNQTGICSKSFTNTIKTTDGGSSWSVASSYGIRDFSFVDNNNGYGASAVGQSMSKTTDGGDTWTSITPPTSNSLWGVAATSSTTAHFVGTGGVYWYTTNGGATVNVGSSGTIDLLTDIFFTSTSTGYIVVQTGEIKKTTNGGSTWTTIHTVSTLLSEMHFVDQNTGFVACSNGSVLRTTDAGSNWTELTTGTTTYLNGIHFYDSDHGVVVGGNGTIYYTSDGGDNWTESPSGVTDHLNDVRMLSGTEAVVIGDNGIILKNSSLGTVKIDEEEQVKMSLYPNPVISSLNIKSDKAINKIEIVDLQGKMIYADNNLQTKNENIDFSSFSSGVYLVHILCDDNQIVRKIVK